MAGLKEKWEKHPLIWVAALVITTSGIGFGFGLKIDSLIAEVSGKNILTDNEVETLKKPATLANDETVIKKSMLTSLKKRPEICPQKVCSKDSSIEVRDCIKEKEPKSITNRLDSYSSDATEKIFKDKYFGRWLCSPGWEIEVYDEPSINSDGYWEISGFWKNPKVRYDIVSVNVVLRISETAKNTSKDERIMIQGRLVRGNSSAIYLTEASLLK